MHEGPRSPRDISGSDNVLDTSMAGHHTEAHLNLVIELPPLVMFIFRFLLDHGLYSIHLALHPLKVDGNNIHDPVETVAFLSVQGEIGNSVAKHHRLRLDVPRRR